MIAPEFRGRKLGWDFTRKAIKSLGFEYDLTICKPHPIVIDEELSSWLSDEAAAVQIELMPNTVELCPSFALLF